MSEHLSGVDEGTRRGAAARAASRARRIGGGAPRAALGVRAIGGATPPEMPANPDLAAPAARRAGTDRARQPARARPWLPALVAAGLVIVLAVADVILLQRWRDQPGATAQRERLIAAVSAAVAKVISYDYRHIDQDAAVAEGYLTGAFKADYTRSMATTIRPEAPKARAVVIGRVVSAGIGTLRSDGREATVLVFGQQTVTNTEQQAPRYDMVSLRVTVQNLHGKWLISKLDRF